MIILNNVDKSFSGTEVLKDINLEIYDNKPSSQLRRKEDG